MVPPVSDRFAQIRARWSRIVASYQDWPDDPSTSQSPALNPDRAFLVAGDAKEDVPYLLDQVERLRAVAEAAKRWRDARYTEEIEQAHIALVAAVDALAGALPHEEKT